MRHIAGFLAAGTVTAAFAMAAPASAEPYDYRIDPQHVVVAFLAGHIGYADVLGRFTEFEGGFTYDEETQRLTDLRVEIDANSVTTDDESRDGHVRSGDFLDAGDHPTIVFEGTNSVPASETRGQVFGNLTVRGETVSVVLSVTLNKAEEYPFATTGPEPNYVLGISARATLQRSDFGMTYALDNGLVGDEVEVIIELEAIRQ